MTDIHIHIDTDYPNADGIATVFAREIFERFTPKPKLSTKVEVFVQNESGYYDRFGKVHRQEGS